MVEYIKKVGDNMLWKVGVYIRLSRDDDYTNSNSINNQKLLIEEYVKSDDNCEIVDYYIDDGYSSTNFDRPAFKKLFSDISIGKINMIIVKDLSRLGRNHIEVSTYLESIFPLFNVRFVSINKDRKKFVFECDKIFKIAEKYYMNVVKTKEKEITKDDIINLVIERYNEYFVHEINDFDIRENKEMFVDVFSLLI